MFTTAAGPDFVLHAGEVYDLPATVAKQLLKTSMVHGIDQDGKPKLGGPCAELVNDRDIKARPLPARPDPEDKPKMELDEEYEALTEDDEEDEDDDEREEAA